MTGFRPADPLRLLRLAAVLAAIAAAIAALAIGRGLARSGGAAYPGATMGATFANIHGVPVVDSLRAGGAAQLAGLRVGDRIEMLDGRDVDEAADLAGLDHAVDLRVRRGADEIELVVTAGE